MSEDDSVVLAIGNAVCTSHRMCSGDQRPSQNRSTYCLYHDRDVEVIKYINLRCSFSVGIRNYNLGIYTRGIICRSYKCIYKRFSVLRNLRFWLFS